MTRETLRQMVHMAMGTFALALRWLTWWQAAACALVALVFNLLALPRLTTALFRDSELRGAPLGGIVFYPVAVLLLVVTFPDRLDIAASAWGILAVGDGIATLVGRAVGGKTLPWNRDKTWAGSVAFFAGASIAGIALAWWTRPAITPLPPAWFAWTAPVVASLLAALVETLPVKLDDNLSVPAAAAATLWAVSKIDLGAAVAAGPVVLGRVTPALLFNGVAAWAGYRAGTVTLSGMIVGFAIGVLMWIGAGAAGWLLLFVCFLTAAASSRVGLERKMVLGIAEARGGRRGPANAVANCGLAALAAVLAVAVAHPALALLTVVTALVAGASDTVASEIGKAFGRTTLLVTSLRRVPPGTSGALSVEGTVAGIAAAFALSVVAWAAGLLPAPWVWIVVVAVTIGSLVESTLGATLEAPGVLNNDVLNFLNTAVSAVVAGVLARSLS